MTTAQAQSPAFIDLFAGCGGLSLGLRQADWRGMFAIERDSMAFGTFRRNFLDGRDSIRFDWPRWLETRAWSISEMLEAHADELAELAGHIDVVAGGPPCQGFSFAGRRHKADPRNQLFKRYVELVRMVRPCAILIENVPGMKVAHGANLRRGRSVPGPKPKSFYEKLVSALDGAGYVASGHILDASRFGVPQRRPRLVVIGLRKELAKHLPGGIERAFTLVEKHRKLQLAAWGLTAPVSARDALDDLLTEGIERLPCVDKESPKGFACAKYSAPSSAYQKLMHDNLAATAMDSMRLVRHTEEVAARFKKILKKCPRGVRMNDTNRELFGILKHRVYPMDPAQPAPTVTTLPDDVLHYSEPRILTVRESARLQSFPDWFAFTGKYTTGGDRRTRECPRYTQVGNAVPPLLATVLGKAVAALLTEARVSVQGGQKAGQRTGVPVCG